MLPLQGLEELQGRHHQSRLAASVDHGSPTANISGKRQSLEDACEDCDTGTVAGWDQPSYLNSAGHALGSLGPSLPKPRPSIGVAGAISGPL